MAKNSSYAHPSLKNSCICYTRSRSKSINFYEFIMCMEVRKKAKIAQYLQSDEC